MGWYVVIKTIKGRGYYYKQTTWRVGRQVKCKSIYIAPADGSIRLGPIPTQPSVGSVGARTGTVPFRLDPVTVPAKDRKGIVPADISEKAFIDLLLDWQPGDEWEKGFSWVGKAPNRPMVLQDPEVFDIPRRMGIAVVTATTGVGHKAPAHLGLRPTMRTGDPFEQFRHMKPTISMPDAGRWRDVGENTAEKLFGMTMLHEIMHATKGWLGRAEIRTRFGRAYAQEELVAEIGACLLARELGILVDDIGYNRDYIRSWRSRLSNADVERAVHDARKAAALVRAFHSKGSWTEGLRPDEVVDRIEREGLEPLDVGVRRPKLVKSPVTTVPGPVVWD